MSTNFTLELTQREKFGTNASRRLHRDGLVPVVIYGAGREVAHYCTDHNALLHNLEIESFHSAIIETKENERKQSVVLREVQMHPFKPQVLHIDLQRVRDTEAITLRVPLHFIGDDAAPGVKTFGGIFSHLISDVEVQCLPKDLPEFLPVDVSQLQISQAVHISDIELPEGVELSSAYQDSDDYAVASVMPSRVSSDVDEESEEEEDALEGGLSLSTGV